MLVFDAHLAITAISSLPLLSSNRDLHSPVDSTYIQKAGTIMYLIKLQNHNWIHKLHLDYFERIKFSNSLLSCSQACINLEEKSIFYAMAP